MAVHYRSFSIVRLFVLFIFFFSLKVQAMEVILTVNINSDWVKVTAKAESIESDQILSSLEEGLKAEIFFQFRVYTISKGLFSILGDRLVYRVDDHCRFRRIGGWVPDPGEGDRGTQRRT